MDAQKKSNSALRGVILTFFELIVVIFINLYIGVIQQWFFPIPAAEFDIFSNVSDWQTFDIPELTVSLKLPPGSHIYTRESLKQGNIYNDENFDRVIERFTLPERNLVVTNTQFSVTFSFCIFREDRLFFKDNYSKYTLSQLDDHIENNFVDGSEDSFYFSNNNHIFVFDKRKYEEDAQTMFFYSTLIQSDIYWFSFLYDTLSVTDTQIKMHNTIIENLEIN
ncbi:MAG: hypothetical protein RR846_09475 [Oscillospiraceae bacterium]